MHGRSTKQRRAAMRRRRLLALVSQDIVTMQAFRASDLSVAYAGRMLTQGRCFSVYRHQWEPFSLRNGLEAWLSSEL